MNRLGEFIRKLRSERKLPLRIVAAGLDIDQAILSKIERGKRQPSRDQVLKLAGFFGCDEKELLVLWIADKVIFELADEEFAKEALQVAEAEIAYKQRSLPKTSSIIRKIKEVLEKDGRIASAWLFGSVVTKDFRNRSDIDIMVEFNDLQKYSMFDLLDISHAIEQRINRKVDLVEKGHLQPFAQKSATKNLLKIYG